MDPALYIILTLGAISATLIVLFAMKTGKRKRVPVKSPEPEADWPLAVGRTVTTTEAKEAQKQLRVLDLEREVLSYAIRRIYEAQAEGEISQQERERLAKRYKERMRRIKGSISRGESIVALHELEDMQDDLVKLFNRRFDELNDKIEGVRSRLGLKTKKKAPVTPSKPKAKPPKKKKRAPKRRKPPPEKTEAEKRIEEIKAEVEKVLQRLGQIEAEE
ncbi:MAG: hypothetical protein GWN86_20140 [Desulfobacterales bacterium]|nr:hypothetical protein [Desulfobacterales bacterium]